MKRALKVCLLLDVVKRDGGLLNRNVSSIVSFINDQNIFRKYPPKPSCLLTQNVHNEWPYVIHTSTCFHIFNIGNFKM